MTTIIQERIVEAPESSAVTILVVLLGLSFVLFFFLSIVFSRVTPAVVTPSSPIDSPQPLVQPLSDSPSLSDPVVPAPLTPGNPAAPAPY